MLPPSVTLSGVWALDLARSQSLDAHLEALVRQCKCFNVSCSVALSGWDTGARGCHRSSLSCRVWTASQGLPEMARVAAAKVECTMRIDLQPSFCTVIHNSVLGEKVRSAYGALPPSRHRRRRVCR